MKKDLAKVYDPKEVEDRLYREWMEKGYFHAEIDDKKKPYTIVMPPPNITGQLHMGHALDNTMQDIIIRWRRMQGYCALWLPGTDHAAIATEAKLVESLAKEGLTKYETGREKFLERAWDWREQYGSKITSQLRKLGSSCDWERERFTMDEGCSKAVNEVFVRLHEKGLIYRGERIINWCPRCRTSISDAEVEHEEHEGFFWHLRYPMADGGGYIEVATTRPETMLGDTAVAVNPNDERYKSYIGKKVVLPLVNREIPVVADGYVEMDFGTGAVKITPAHDPNDFEVGMRHNLPVIDVMTDDGKINENGGKYNGMERYECRKQIVKDLETGGFLVKVEPMKHNVGGCYRCGTVVEPKVSKQWFVKMHELAQPAIKAVKSGELKFVPERFEKIYLHWLENIQDWCISRQLWWGHRIPAWYCDNCGGLIISRDEPENCNKCKSTYLHQDEDTLDTWFSSALWPFSTLGWPDKTPELDYFYPTDTLVTAYDIIFFWVVRMVFSGLEHMGQIPFKTVFIHGLIRDPQGRKMSKSLGNGVDPLELIEQYGADALRFAVSTGNAPGNDMRFSNDKVESSRNFANKIWNANRFILMNLDGDERPSHIPDNLLLEDKWILSKYNRLVREVTENLEKFELGIAVQKLYEFIWDEFCDWYIEIAKVRLQGDATKTVRELLVYVMSNTLKLLHPFMPFITEEIYKSLPHDGDSIMISSWPVYDEKLDFHVEEQIMESNMELIRAVRNRRSEMNVPPSKKANIFIETENEGSFIKGRRFIEKLAFAKEVKINGGHQGDKCVTIVTRNAKVFIPIDELIDIGEERARLCKELEAAQKNLERVNAKLSNEGFLKKAPENVVNSQRAAYEEYNKKIEMLKESLQKLGR